MGGRDLILSESKTKFCGAVIRAAAVLARLRERGLDHHMSEVPQMNLRQVFVAEPVEFCSR